MRDEIESVGEMLILLSKVGVRLNIEDMRYVMDNVYYIAAGKEPYVNHK